MSTRLLKAYNKGLHWIIPAFGIALVGFGLGAVVDITLTYLTDSYQDVGLHSSIGLEYLHVSVCFIQSSTRDLDGLAFHLADLLTSLF